MYIKRDRVREGEDIYELVINFCVLQNVYNKIYLSMLDNVLKMESYYYSINYDLIYSFQRFYNISFDFYLMFFLERVNKVYLFICILFFIYICIFYSRYYVFIDILILEFNQIEREKYGREMDGNFIC